MSRKMILMSILSLTIFTGSTIIAPLYLMIAYGETTIAALPNPNPNNTVLVQNNLMINNSAYETPTLSDITIFNTARESNEELMDELAKVLNCDETTLCQLVYSGHGIIRLEFFYNMHNMF